jgi:hypothetical protein
MALLEARAASTPGSTVGAAPDATLEAAISLERWMRERDFAGYDPFDLLNSPLCSWLAATSRWAGVAVIQLGKRSPINLRPLLGVRPQRNAKGIGLILAAYSRLWTRTGDPQWKSRAAELVQWLAQEQRPGMSGACWGYNFPWANRSFIAPRGTPSGVVTSFVGHALLDAAERLGVAEAGPLAERAAGFLLRDLNRTETDAAGRFGVSYTPVDRRFVHNASVLAASLLARIAERTSDRESANAALAIARYTAHAQREDGAWPYGTARRDQWVDGFHTSYTLLALREVSRRLRTDEFDSVIERGTAYWVTTFLAREGVSHTSESHFPIDSHAVAHALIALRSLSDLIPDSRARIERVAEWSLGQMRHPTGYFYYHKHSAWTNRIPYMRWVQAWMLLALSEIASADSTRMADQ